MGHLLTGAIVLMIYFFMRAYFIKRSFYKIAKILSEKLDLDKSVEDFSDISPKKATNFYILQNDCKSFKSLNKDKADLSISDLKYNGLIRFIRMINNYSNQSLRPSDKEFFIHNSHRHLLYPFKTSGGEIKLLLLERTNVSLDDLINRNPRK